MRRSEISSSGCCRMSSIGAPDQDCHKKQSAPVEVRSRGCPQRHRRRKAAIDKHQRSAFFRWRVLGWRLRFFLALLGLETLLADLGFFYFFRQCHFPVQVCVSGRVHFA